MIKITCTIICCLCLLTTSGICQTATSTNQSTNNNQLGINFGDSPGTTISDIRTAPNTPLIMHNEIPAYFGPFADQMWNTQEHTLLPFVVMVTHEFEVISNLLDRNITKRKIRLIHQPKMEPMDHVKILNGMDKLEDLTHIFIGTTTTYGKKKNTSLDCLCQAIVDTGEHGGNVFVLFKVGSDAQMSSTTWGLGGSGANNFGMTGKDAYSAGTAMGISSNQGGPVRLPYVQGIMIKVPDKEYKAIKPLGINAFLKIKKSIDKAAAQLKIDRQAAADNE